MNKDIDAVREALNEFDWCMRDNNIVIHSSQERRKQIKQALTHLDNIEAQNKKLGDLCDAVMTVLTGGTMLREDVGEAWKLELFDTAKQSLQQESDNG